MTHLSSPISNLSKDWREQLDFVVAMMRELSSHTDPQEMRKAYAARMRTIIPVDATISLSRRDLQSPWYRVTRATRWEQEINPWKEKHRLPLLEGGLCADLLYNNYPRLYEDLAVAPSDPMAEYFQGYQSLAAVPLYDNGEALNMILLLREEPDAFQPDQFPQIVWMSNLYGRVTHNLVLKHELADAYAEVDHELKVVADIQRSLLPSEMPSIPTLGVAAHYQTSRQAGGDYYDFFPLSDGRWGMIIADVSGHGTPAAVVMAVMHALAHTYPGQHDRPGQLLEYLNQEIYRLHTSKSDNFVTAFHAIYDPASRTLTYASAGHNPPRLKRCSDGSLALLDRAGGMPLGIMARQNYADAEMTLVVGDQVILYTDGITEASNATGQMFGLARLDKVLENCIIGAPDILQSVLDALHEYTGGGPAHDDRTILVLKVNG